MDLSLFGLIARPVTEGGFVDEEEEVEEVREEVEEVDDGVEDKDEDVEPELSCLINSAARSDYLISSASGV